MPEEKFRVAVDKEIVQEVDELVVECTDLGAFRSKIVEAELTVYFKFHVNHTARVRELVIRRRKNL